MPSPPAAAPDLAALVDLFYSRPADLGQFEEVSSAEMPADYRRLLAHDEHMTVTVEQFHQSPVDVTVLERKTTGDHYARKILLRRQRDSRVVQFGIVRLRLAFLDEPVRREILAERTPLGRVLIQHDVMRQVRLCGLWRVTPGSDLRELLGTRPGQLTFGRTAIIDCNGEPAIELLEIVAPVEK